MASAAADRTRGLTALVSGEADVRVAKPVLFSPDRGVVLCCFRREARRFFRLRGLRDEVMVVCFDETQQRVGTRNAGNEEKSVWG